MKRSPGKLVVKQREELVKFRQPPGDLQSSPFLLNNIVILHVSNQLNEIRNDSDLTCGRKEIFLT